MIAIVGRAALAVFGTAKPLAARVVAALAGTALTAVALAMARRLGGRSIALGLTALALFAAPVFVRPAVLLQPMVFDQLWYAVAISEGSRGCRRRAG